MYTQGLKQIQFEPASSAGDWQFPYRLLMPQLTAWNPAVDLVVLGITPDYAAWDDYGFRQRSTLAPTPDYWNAPVYQANSDDNPDVVALVDPNLISIIVPWNAMRSLGPGGCQVAVSYRAKDTERRTPLLVGRLPIVYGVV